MARTNYRIDENGDVWRVCRVCGKEGHQDTLKINSHCIGGVEACHKKCHNKIVRKRAYRERSKRRYDKLIGTGKELMADKPEYEPSVDEYRECNCSKRRYCRDRVMGKVAKRHPMCVIPDRNDIEWQRANLRSN